MKPIAIILFCSLLCGQLQAADDALKKRDRLSIHFENDMFAATDRYYTNGVQIRSMSRDLETMELPDWAANLKSSLAILRRPGYTHNIGFALGQSLFTPEDISLNPPDPADHPYAGWLYASLSLHHKNAREMHTLELTLGVVGPPAQGEDAQNGIHGFRNLDKARGWDHELNTEIGVVATYQQKRRFVWAAADGAGWGLDLLPDMSLSVGNVLTRATLGGTVRVGWNLPRDFHATRVRAAGTAPLGVAESANAGRWSAYAFTGIQGQGVAHNIFLDGNTFSSSPSVNREPWVAEASAGIGIRYHTISLVWTQVFRSREFSNQISGQQFGSLTLSLDY